MQPPLPHRPPRGHPWRPLVAAGDRRRHRLALAIVARRQPRYARGSRYVRSAALVGCLLISVASAHRVAALLLALPALCCLVLDVGQATRHRCGPYWRLGCWPVVSLLLVTVPVWVATDLPLLPRVVQIGMALTVVVSATTAVLVDPGWFDPATPSVTRLELLRHVVAPVTAAVSVAITMPATWPPDLRLAIWALALLPLAADARRWNLEDTLRRALPLIREEGQLGRDQILRDIHGALSTELRQVEQQARARRLTSPTLYELAVNANSALRETLTLADEGRDTSTTTDTLMAPVLTLTRAEGVSATARIEVADLHPQDREVARYVLFELVGNALRAGATQLQIAITQPVRPGLITVAVTDDGAAMATDSWRRPGSRSAALEAALTARSGTLELVGDPEPGTKSVRACWLGRR